MKRVAVLILSMLLLLSGCNTQPQEQAQPDETKLVYATFFPLYAITERVIRGVPDLHLRTLIQPQDGCIRDYQLSDLDIAKIAAADAIIMAGRSLESFEGAFFTDDIGLTAIAAYDGLTLIGQGTETDGEEGSHFDGENPWLFLSVEGAGLIMESIAGAMASVDPDYEAQYAENLHQGLEELEDLYADMQAALTAVNPVSVGLMHEGLVYMAEDLGLHVACHVDREPGTAVYDNDLMITRADLKGTGAKVVLLEKQAPDQLKNAMKDAGYQVALIDTLTTFPMGAAFDHYLEAMRGNARAIAGAFAETARQAG